MYARLYIVLLSCSGLMLELSCGLKKSTTLRKISFATHWPDDNSHSESTSTTLPPHSSSCSSFLNLGD